MINQDDIAPLLVHYKVQVTCIYGQFLLTIKQTDDSNRIIFNSYYTLLASKDFNLTHASACMLIVLLIGVYKKWHQKLLSTRLLYI